MKNLLEARVARLVECHKKQKAGYNQHTSPNSISFTEYHKNPELLVDMKKDNKSDYTINFTRKALTFLSKHTSLQEPEAVKLFISTLKHPMATKETYV